MITPFRSVFKFGLPLGIILFTQFYFATKSTIDSQEILPNYVSYIQIGTIMLAIVLSCLDHRKKFTGRVMKFSEAIGCGVLTVAFAAVLFSITTFLYLYINPEIGVALKQITLKTMPNGIPKDTFKLTPLKECLLAAVQGFIQTFMIGFISSLLIGFMVQKRNTD